MTSLYNDYKRRHADEALVSSKPLKQLTKFEKYNLLEDDYDVTDDLERFLREDRAPADTNPLVWWQHNQHRYPILRYMAFDLLGTPASSSADERTFSKADRSLNIERFNTLDDLAEANQCMKSWIDEGLIYKMPKDRRNKNKKDSTYTGIGNSREVYLLSKVLGDSDSESDKTHASPTLPAPPTPL